MVRPYRRPIHLSAPLPEGLNPYGRDGICLQLALAHGDLRTIKEIVAYNIIRVLILAGKLRPGDTAIDATSGNTGRAYAGILQPLGIYLRLIVQGTMPAGKLAQLGFYGKGVEVVPHFGPESTIKRARREAAENGYVLLDQYANEANPLAHEQYTGLELWQQLLLSGDPPGAIVVPLGTCGTALGLSRFFKARNKDTQIIGVAVDPEQRVPQIPGMRTPEQIDDNVLLTGRKELIDHVYLAKRTDAILGTRRLAYADPSSPGLSTGAAYVVALRYIEENRVWLRNKRVIIISPDSIEAYLAIMQAEQDDTDVANALSNSPEF